MTTELVLAYAVGMAAATGSLYKVHQAIKRAHSEMMTKMDHQQIEIMRLQTSIERMVTKLDSIPTRGERLDS